MSEPIPGITSVPASSRPRSISRKLSAGGSTKGLMATRPAISGWWMVNQMARVPPIERPTTTTLRHRPASSVYAPSATSDQSSQRLGSMSSIEVPCPGSSGSSTANPAPARASARPRIDCGLPVNPWRTRAPSRLQALDPTARHWHPPILRPTARPTANVRRRQLASGPARATARQGDQPGQTTRVPVSKELSTVAKYPFLSPQWVEAAKTIREDYRGKIPPTAHVMRLNQVITEVPFGDGTINAHVDTTTGELEMELGHLDGPDLQVTLDYATAKAIFV